MNEKKLKYYNMKTKYARWYGKHADQRLHFETQTEAFDQLHNALLAQTELESYANDLETLVKMAFLNFQFGKATKWARDNAPNEPFWATFIQIFGQDAINKWLILWEQFNLPV